MGSMMKAAVARQFGAPLQIEEVPIPVPGPKDVLVRVMASGVCHTDLHAVEGDWPVQATLPLIPGHEGVGIVAAVGAEVKDLKEGDPVGVPWLHDACGCCEPCRTGWETLCPSQHNTGYSVAGGYAEYVVAPAAYVGKLPNKPDFFNFAPILCAGVTTYKGLKETEVRPGEWVAMIGVGGLGHIGVQYAKAMGMHVVAVDIADDKLKLAKELGADIVVNAAEEDPAAAVQKEIGGVHGALVTAVSPRSFEQGIGMLRSRGTMALVGLPPGKFATPIFDVVLKRLTIRGSIVGTRQDLAECIAFAAEGKVKAVIEVQPLEKINEIFTRMKNGEINGRVVLDPNA